ncbi:cupin domain-containing protein [Candidatus Thorarchaeota archaeon]|nr:MAG: cupin domain-containing protein [Candidatus Thorarchaeota archaeon]
MKRIHESEISLKVINGKVGSVFAYDIIDEEIQAGIRVIKSNSDVPTRPHIHRQRQIIYVITGSAEITNEKQTLKLNPGDFLMLEANEEHYVRTSDDEVKVFEIKYP